MAAGTERRGSGGWDTVLATEAHDVTPGGEWRSELHAIAVAQFERACDVLALEPEARARLREPRRALVVNFPVRRDDGTVETFIAAAERLGCDWRTAAQAVAVERVAEAGRLRAIYP